MKYLIDKEVLNNRLAFFTVPTDIWEAIQHMPIVDAVPVVRCKDCKFSDWYTAIDGNRYCYCMEHGSSGHKGNDFCSYGEKDGDHHEG